MVRNIREGFPWRHRIVRGADYRAVYDAGQKLHSERFVLFAKANTLGRNRLGITVSRKVGGAVVRNRVKRLFREIFRRSSAEIHPTFDIILNAKRSCAGAGYKDLRAEFLAAIGRLSKPGVSDGV